MRLQVEVARCGIRMRVKLTVHLLFFCNHGLDFANKETDLAYRQEIAAGPFSHLVR